MMPNSLSSTFALCGPMPGRYVISVFRSQIMVYDCEFCKAEVTWCREFDVFTIPFYQCYFLSNGRRSCQTILLTESDPDLIRSSDAGLRGDQSEASKRLFYQSRRVVSDSNLSWQDICEVAMIVREIDIRDRKIAADRRARQKAAATGLMYSSYGAYTMACGLTPKTSAGNCVEIAQGNTGKWNEALELHV